ncbi:hypothetical protein H0H87_000429 [Tephrocybe sp. NHM501043]|nr:hypothetical protein H0H87_000429 [Tephrocybe sp. NHM501043]
MSSMQRAFHLSQTKAVKRDEAMCDDNLCLYLAGIKVVGRRSSYSSHSQSWSLKKHGKSYKISHKQNHPHSHSNRHPIRQYVHVGREEQKLESGIVDIVSATTTDNGKLIGHLYMENATSHVGASPTNHTTMQIVEMPSTVPSEGNPMKIVKLQVPVAGDSVNSASVTDEPGAAGSHVCLGYKSNAESTLSASPCGEDGQTFGYDEKTHYIVPLEHTPPDSSSSGQGVLARDDGTKPVVLRFNPAKSASVADIAEPSAINSSDTTLPTSTMTTTVTVTNTPAASLSAADVAATPTANASASSTSVASLTSTTNGATPTAGAVGTPGAAGTAGAAGIMDVQVVQPSNASSVQAVQPSSASSAMLSASLTSAYVVPTTTMNAQDVAASIAGSSTAVSVTASTVPSSSSAGVTPSSVSGSEPSSAPSVRAVETDPYKWVFRRE